MTRDINAGRAAHVNAPAERFNAVTPRDGQDLPGGVTRAIYVAEEGAVAVEDAFGNAVVLQSGPSQYHPLRVARVLATGTTAAGIVALY